jgi:hypothetical protein
MPIGLANNGIRFAGKKSPKKKPKKSPSLAGAGSLFCCHTLRHPLREEKREVANHSRRSLTKLQAYDKGFICDSWLSVITICNKVSQATEDELFG